MSSFEQLRQQMIDYQLVARGLHHQSVLNALNNVPREKFIPTELIDTFWSQEEHRLSKSWLDHEDINNVMLATSLAPESYLGCVWAI